MNFKHLLSCDTIVSIEMIKHYSNNEQTSDDFRGNWVLSFDVLQQGSIGLLQLYRWHHHSIAIEFYFHSSELSRESRALLSQRLQKCFLWSLKWTVEHITFKFGTQMWICQTKLRDKKSGNLLHRITMRIRNTKWLWNPGKQSKLGQIFSHMRSNYHSESGLKEKIIIHILLICIRKGSNYYFFSFDLYMSHLITVQKFELSPILYRFHSSLMFCTSCACAKGRFLVKTQFYDLVHFISIDSMFVPNLEPTGLSSQIKDTKYLFFSKWQNTHALTHLSTDP